jgi:predicted PurR-regulated permease PerM
MGPSRANQARPLQQHHQQRSTDVPVIAGGKEPSPDTANVSLAGWMEDRRLSVYVLLVLTTGALYLTYMVFRPFLTALFLALILAVAFFPLHQWVSRHIRNSCVAALTTTVLAIITILAPLVLVSARLASEAGRIYVSVLQPLGNPVVWPQRLNPVLEGVADATGVPIEELRVDVAVEAKQAASWLFRIAASFGQHFAQQLVTLVLAFVFLWPLLQYSGEFRAGALSVLPLSQQRTRELVVAVNQGIVADIYGVIVVGIVEGALIALSFWLAGLGSPLFWGVIATVLSCVPFVGVSLVWIPACILLALRGNWTNAILLLVWCSLVVSTVEGTVRSTIVSGHAKVNSMLVMLSIMGGVVAFGAVGIFAGPVVVVLVGTLVRILREEHALAQAAPNLQMDSSSLNTFP